MMAGKVAVEARGQVRWRSLEGGRCVFCLKPASLLVSLGRGTLSTKGRGCSAENASMDLPGLALGEAKGASWRV
ncbi:hypothetical protein LZ30DRAFT_715645 [Colletotrichum cereale]|nr:hypothetical protein LZ30DRAFT_715645 [Colletotrichum cereale]